MIPTGPRKVCSQDFQDLCLRQTHLPAQSSTHGDLQVRCCNLHKTESSSLDVWEYTPGEFEWQVDADLSACVLSGSGELDLSDGRLLCLRPGTAVFLPRGLHGRWVIKETLRTVSVKGRAA